MVRSSEHLIPNSNPKENFHPPALSTALETLATCPLALQMQIVGNTHMPKYILNISYEIGTMEDESYRCLSPL